MLISSQLSLTKLAALDIDNLLIKTQSISKDVLFNVFQALLKEWGQDSLSVLLEDIMQELSTGVTFSFSQFMLLMLTFFHTYSYLYHHLDHFTAISFPVLSGFKAIGTCCSSRGKSGSYKNSLSQN